MKFFNALLLLICFSICNNLYSQSKYITDKTYGIKGKIESKGQEDFLGTLLIQPDGKQIVCARITEYPLYGIYLTRYKLKGIPDSTFGINGEVKATQFNTWLVSAQLLPDGKILCLGQSNNQAQLIRFLKSGKIDSSFGNNGLAAFNFTSGYSHINVFQVTQTGSIVVAGTFDIIQKNVFILRFDSLGIIDKNFGQKGIKQFHWKDASPIVSIKAQSDGKIILVADNNYKIGLKRFLYTGVPDSSYGVNSEAYLHLSSSAFASDAYIQQDDKLLITGSYANTKRTGFITRMNRNSKPDKTFGDSNGYTFIQNTDEVYPVKILIQPDKKILLPFENFRLYNGSDYALMRIYDNGLTDSSFGVNGQQIILSNVDSGEGIFDAGLRYDGKLILGCEKHVENDSELYVHRILRCFKSVSETLMKKDSLRAVSFGSQLRVYPNPASNIIYLNGLPGISSTVVISDVSGRIVYSKRVSGGNASLNISTLLPGVYYLKDNLQNFEFKFIKQ